MKGIYTFLILMFLSISAAYAQEGPIVPCVGCDSLTQAPFPETGLWFNPEQTPGSGLNFEIQNGVLAGFFYGYATDGKPEWQLVSGALVPSEVEGVLWELETTLTRADGGSCIGCEFSPPQITEGETIRLEFMQRNYLRIRIGGVFDQFFVPFIYGMDAEAYFPNETDYLFPKFVDSTPFVLGYSIKWSDGVTYWDGGRVIMLKLIGIIQVNNKRTLRYGMGYPESPIISDPPPPPFGNIDCQLDDVVDEPFCVVAFSEFYGSGQYRMPIGNFRDSRFFAEAKDGSTIQGLRLGYD